MNGRIRFRKSRERCDGVKSMRQRIEPAEPEATAFPFSGHVWDRFGIHRAGMTKNILALIAIFLCTTAAWAILGATIMARTHSAGSGLSSRVESTWGAPQQQGPPALSTSRIVPKLVQETIDGRQITRSVEETVVTPMPLEQSRVRVDLD